MQIIYVNTTSGNYFYHRDITGNIIGIVDKLGNYMVKYTYNVWGKVSKTVYNTCTDTALATNPFMFKGYFYDDETGFYYLKSRYYYPDICCFISMDDIDYLDETSILGVNLYAYCYNNPIMYVDLSGHSAIFVFERYQITSSHFVLFSRGGGKTPPVNWPDLPPNLAGKNPKWNSNGYWEGKGDNYVWDRHSHGTGVDRGNGPQGGHWDGENTGDRFREDGTPLPGNKNKKNKKRRKISETEIVNFAIVGGGAFLIAIICFDMFDNNLRGAYI